jgi:hypothetical protein
MDAEGVRPEDGVTRTGRRVRSTRRQRAKQLQPGALETCTMHAGCGAEGARSRGDVVGNETTGFSQRATTARLGRLVSRGYPQRAGVLRRTEAGGARQPKCKPARHAGWTGGNTSDSGKMGLGRNGLTTLVADTVGWSQSAWGLSRLGKLGDVRQGTLGMAPPPWAKVPMASRKDDTAAGGGGTTRGRRGWGKRAALPAGLEHK